MKPIGRLLSANPSPPTGGWIHWNGKGRAEQGVKPRLPSTSYPEVLLVARRALLKEHGSREDEPARI